MFSHFREMLREALSFDAERSHACSELYEIPGGHQVDGSPPAPVFIRVVGFLKITLAFGQLQSW
eukprot:8143699-Pyramimonas_sp.AAC.1